MTCVNHCPYWGKEGRLTSPNSHCVPPTIDVWVVVCFPVSTGSLCLSIGEEFAYGVAGRLAEVVSRVEVSSDSLLELGIAVVGRFKLMRSLSQMSYYARRLAEMILTTAYWNPPGYLRFK